ncbi:unnamed protein product [Vicia faba]|uniref:Uncharacterized protein n=1 Tax=Vicia faba TaxID=3906 RepID=A0AAV1B111_VICFA|nr:unnamed protein product [Vicia faba]
MDKMQGWNDAIDSMFIGIQTYWDKAALVHSDNSFVMNCFIDAVDYFEMFLSLNDGLFFMVGLEQVGTMLSWLATDLDEA